MTNLLEDFANAVARHPDRIAIVDGAGRETTFAQLKSRADGLARGWHARGVRRGDRVLLAMALDADLYASLAALWSIGATVVLPEPAMGVAGLRHAARVADVSAFCSSGLYGLLKYAPPELWGLRHLRPKPTSGAPLDLPPPAEADVALISFTSGTTGAPKAIPRSHGFLTSQHRAIAPLLESEAAERDLVAFPVFVLINIASGQTSILPNWKMSRLDQINTEMLTRFVNQQQISRVLLPPALCEKLAVGSIPSSLHTVFTGGGPVFPDILAKLRDTKPDLNIHCVYGSTEAEPIAHLDARDITAKDYQSMITGGGLLVGYPASATQVRVVEDEIQVAGGHVNQGYLDPAHDAENKVNEGATIWHRTGDAGYFDKKGRLWLLGRIGTEVSGAKGRHYPFSIEVAARQWAGVNQCALASKQNAPCLVVEGDAQHLNEWCAHAATLGIDDVKHVVRIPMDKRHGSKVDRRALNVLIGANAGI